MKADPYQWLMRRRKFKIWWKRISSTCGRSSTSQSWTPLIMRRPSTSFSKHKSRRVKTRYRRLERVLGWRFWFATCLDRTCEDANWMLLPGTFILHLLWFGRRALCKLNCVWFNCFETVFGEYYDTIYHYKTNRLRNIAKFFRHLPANYAISWNAMGCIKLTEEDTTSSSRIFVKLMHREKQESMGLKVRQWRNFHSTTQRTPSLLSITSPQLDTNM